MREQPMVSHPDAEASCNPPQQKGEHKGFPAEYEKSRQCAGMKQHHKEGREPDDGLLKSPVASKTIWNSHNSVPRSLNCLSEIQPCWPLTSTLPAFSREPALERGMAEEEGSAAFRYCDHFTARFPMLVKFEQFG
jgi:hypothetical protein